jgi:hypothetical protein
VYVGQQIQFTACIPSGTTATSESWSPTAPIGTAVGGYVASTNSGKLTALTPPSCGTAQNCDFPTFYWVDAANQRQFTFSYTANGGQTASATVTFDVAGPTQPNISAAVGTVQIGLLSKDQTGHYQPDPNGKPSMILFGVQVPGGVAGISFLASAVLPQSNSGAYSWAQILKQDQLTLRTGGNSNPICNPLSGVPALDLNYPYGALTTTNVPNDTATDNPISPLISSSGSPYYETTRSFSATMYLLWNPTSTGSIPVPLASMDWQFKADAINTGMAQQNGTQFILGCQYASGAACHVTIPSQEANQGYPTWGAVADGTLSCH